MTWLSSCDSVIKTNVCCHPGADLLSKMLVQAWIRWIGAVEVRTGAVGTDHGRDVVAVAAVSICCFTPRFKPRSKLVH